MFAVFTWLISIYYVSTAMLKTHKKFSTREKRHENPNRCYRNHPPMNPQSTTKIRPAKRLMEASGKCSSEGLAYGNCVLNNYTTIKKDMCGQEFIKFKTCVTNQLAKK